MEKKNFLKELFLPENKKARMNLFTAFAVGVLLLIMGNTFFGVKPEVTEVPEKQEEKKVLSGKAEEEQLEERLEGILCKIDGAGEVDVMVTLKGTAQSVVAKNEKSEENVVTEEGTQGISKTTQSTKKEDAVVMTEDGRGNTSPLILQENVPEVEGIIIVAQGGGDPIVQQTLTAAAQALLNVPAHKIAVLKMK